MKKLFVTLLLLLLAMGGFQPTAHATEQKSFGDVTYKIATLKNGAREVHITGFVKMKNHIDIPAQIEGLPVVEIIDRAFYFDRADYASDGTFEPSELPGYSDLFIESVNLPSTLKRIGEEAFFRHHIQQLTLPAGLQEIGYQAFGYNELTDITIPKSVQKIGGNIVVGNPIKTYNVPVQFKKPTAKQAGRLLYVTFTHNGKKEARITGHTYNTAQTKIVIPKTINKLPVTEIGDYAFSNESSLLGLQEDRPFIKEVALPSTIRKIGNHAFSGVRYDNNTKRSFSLPANVEVIGDYAFADNGITNRGKNFTFPQKLKSIGKGAFQRNNFQAVTIPFNVKTLGKEAFAYNDLKNVTLGNGITSIPAGAFRGNHITSLVLSKHLTSIEEKAFMDNHLPRLLLPANVETIGDFAFASNKLTSVSLTNQVNTIGDGAFAYNQLTAFDVPSKLQVLPFNALLMNPLQSIKFQGGATKMVDYGAYQLDYGNNYSNVFNNLKQLSTDAQHKKPWTKWNEVIPARTTLYVQWLEPRS